ncbi:MAG: L-threonine 3-dehydrogenase [Acidobacteria bacterium]|nr:L-threonine 3-dehydrogenase [Acidobacteriota bacterium]
MAASMTAVAKLTPAPGADVIEAPVPSVGPGDLLVRVKAASICGTDLHIHKWDQWARGRIKPPLVFGHEFCGEVVETGASVTTFKSGDYVSVETHVFDATCDLCRLGRAHVCRNVSIIGIDRQGCFAEYVCVPERSAWRLDVQVPQEIGAVLDPLGNAVHTTLAGDVTGRSVAVIGCGPIGCMAIGVARAAGASLVVATELNEYRRELARAMRPDHVFNPAELDAVEAVRDATDGAGADVVLEMSGHSSGITQALKVAKPGGRISLLGLPSKPVEIDLSIDVIFKGVTIQGINGRRIWETWYQMQALLVSGALDVSPLITHRFPLSRFSHAIDLLTAGRAGKIILYP